MITPTIKSTNIDFGMESSCEDSIPKYSVLIVNQRMQNFPSIDSRVESSVGYFKPKIFLANSRLEFVVKSKFPINSSERCH